MEKESDTKKNKFNEITLTCYILIIFGLILVLGFPIYVYLYPDDDYLSLIPTISGAFLVIVTSLYVITTSKQLNAMKDQLLEMKMERVMRDQPLPWLRDFKFEIEQPNLFRFPESEKYEFYSKFHLTAIIENLSSYPAPCIDVRSRIDTSNDINKESYLYSVFNRISALTQGMSQEISHLYYGDNRLYVYDKLKNTVPCTIDFPEIQIETIYRSLAGGYFVIDNLYDIIPNYDLVETLTEWESEIIQFQNKYREVFQHHSQLVAKGLHDEAEKYIDDFIESVLPQLPIYGQEKRIEFSVSEIPGKLIIRQISEDEYNYLLEDSVYPRRRSDG